MIIIALLVAMVAAVSVILLTVNGGNPTPSFTPTFTGTISVGVQPVGVAVSPDGHRAYINNHDTGSVSVVDTDAGTVTATITVGVQPVGVAVSRDGRRAYITNNGSGTVSVIDIG